MESSKRKMSLGIAAATMALGDMAFKGVDGLTPEIRFTGGVSENPLKGDERCFTLSPAATRRRELAKKAKKNQVYQKWGKKCQSPLG